MQWRAWWMGQWPMAAAQETQLWLEDPLPRPPQELVVSFRHLALAHEQNAWWWADWYWPVAMHGAHHTVCVTHLSSTLRGPCMMSPRATVAGLAPPATHTRQPPSSYLQRPGSTGPSHSGLPHRRRCCRQTQAPDQPHGTARSNTHNTSQQQPVWRLLLGAVAHTSRLTTCSSTSTAMVSQIHNTGTCP